MKLPWRLRKQTPAPEAKVPLAVREQSERCLSRRRRSRTDKDSIATDKESNDGPRFHHALAVAAGRLADDDSNDRIRAAQTSRMVILKVNLL